MASPSASGRKQYCALRPLVPLSGALKANEYDGRVNVNNHNAENLAKSWSNNGGRAADVLGEKHGHHVMHGAHVVLRVKTDFLPRIFPPHAQHITDLLQAFLPVYIPINFVNAAIVHETDQ